MKKTTFLFLICVLFAGISLSGCSTVAKQINPTLSMDIEYGYFDNGDDMPATVMVVVTNNHERAATDVEISLTPYDAEGNVIYADADESGGYTGSGTITELIPLIMPGESAGLCSYAFHFLSEKPDHVEAEITSAIMKDVSDIPEGTVTIKDFSYDMGADRIYVTLENTTDNDYDASDPEGHHSLNVIVIAYDSDGKIVGGDDGTVQYLEAHSEGQEEVYLLGLLAGTSAESVKVFPLCFDY